MNKNELYIPKRRNFKKLYEKNNFTIDISEKSNVEKETFVGGNEYLLSSLELKLKEDDITIWEDYKKNQELSNLINHIKKKFINHKFKRLYKFIK